MSSAKDALTRLQEGNHRYLSATKNGDADIGLTRRQALVSGQQPFAIILGCADSRVPPEVVFDQGLGDLFVIRVAGNIVTPSLLGSVEYAAAKLGTRLIVVLGHTNCGAVAATVDELIAPNEALSPNLRAIVDAIKPVAANIMGTDTGMDKQAVVEHAVRANVSASVDQLTHSSKLLAQLIREDGLMVVGAEYSLETGNVAFFVED